MKTDQMLKILDEEIDIAFGLAADILTRDHLCEDDLRRVRSHVARRLQEKQNISDCDAFKVGPPKPIEIKSFVVNRDYADLTVVAPSLNHHTSGNVWRYDRYALRCVPVDGVTIKWDKWNNRDIELFPMWKHMGLLPETLSFS